MSNDLSSALTYQLALAIELNHEATLNDFCWDSNGVLKQQIERSLTKKSELMLYLWGNKGCGKSHLLQACCHSLHLKEAAIYLPLAILKPWGPEILEGIAHQGLIAIDDIDVIAGDTIWEEALFHLYNKIHDAGNSLLIIAGQKAPVYSLIKLADLKSRLSWGIVAQVHELADESKIKTLQMHAQKRGFQLSAKVGKFLLNRSSRNMHDLQTVIEQLDAASLSAHRKITLPFVKAVLRI